MAPKMYRARVGVLAAALGIVLTGVTSAAAAAQPTSHAGPALSARVSPAALPCWTSFNPTAPHGGALDQYFVNCNSYPVTVCPALETSSGTTVWASSAVSLTAYGAGSDTASWHYDSTVQSGQYTTVYCY
ncbi:hypothetical protein [Streptomyces sp. NRRL F-5123]|uniref:hypothetical protein n=1 Tax=Streptomyces sp. NRRL F-5123 TaxID=1463856 RepID=UPI0004E1999B|nr:hypothetical protein [Streptomyces sp. NRRL F-5123]